MSRQKASLIKRDQYQVLVAALECARLLAHAGSCGVVRTSVAVEGDRPPLDDIFVTFTNGVVERWQVKKQSTELDANNLIEILQECQSLPENEKAIFAVQDLVDVAGVGELRVIRDLCDRITDTSELSAVESQLNKKEKEILKHLISAMGITAKDVLAILRKLEIKVLGTPGDLERFAIDGLRTIYGSSAESVFSTLVNHINKNIDTCTAYSRETLEKITLNASIPFHAAFEKECSTSFINAYAMSEFNSFLQIDNLIYREVWAQLVQSITDPGVTLVCLSGHSGNGKSTLMFQAMREYNNLSHDLCLWIHHDDLENASTPEAAMRNACQRVGLPVDWTNRLVARVRGGHTRVLLVIDDVNRSSKTTVLARKLETWCAPTMGDTMRTTVIYSLWPYYSFPPQRQDKGEKTHKQTHRRTIPVPSFSVAESHSYLKSRFGDDNWAEILADADAFLHDPLILSLYDGPSQASSPIDEFVEASLRPLADLFDYDEVVNAVDDIVEHCISNSTIDVSMDRLMLSVPQGHTVAKRDVVRAVLRDSGLYSVGVHGNYHPRHDRVYDTLLVRFYYHRRRKSTFALDPFYFRVAGEILIKDGTVLGLGPRELVNTSPFALIHAMRGRHLHRVRQIADTLQSYLVEQSSHLLKCARSLVIWPLLLRIGDLQDDVIEGILEDRRIKTSTWLACGLTGKAGNARDLLEYLGTLFHSYGDTLFWMTGDHLEILTHISCASRARICDWITRGWKDLSDENGLAVAVLFVFLEWDELREAIVDTAMATYAAAYDLAEIMEHKDSIVTLFWAISKGGFSDLVVENVIQLWVRLDGKERSSVAYEVGRWSMTDRAAVQILRIARALDAAAQVDVWRDVMLMIARVDHVEVVKSQIKAEVDFRLEHPNGSIHWQDYRDRWHIAHPDGQRLGSQCEDFLREIWSSTSDDRVMRKLAWQIWDGSSHGDSSLLPHLSNLSSCDELYLDSLWSRVWRGDVSVEPELVSLLEQDFRTGLSMLRGAHKIWTTSIASLCESVLRQTFGGSDWDMVASTTASALQYLTRDQLEAFFDRTSSILLSNCDLLAVVLSAGGPKLTKAVEDAIVSGRIITTCKFVNFTDAGGKRFRSPCSAEDLPLWLATHVFESEGAIIAFASECVDVGGSDFVRNVLAERYPQYRNSSFQQLRSW